MTTNERLKSALASLLKSRLASHPAVNSRFLGIPMGPLFIEDETGFTCSGCHANTVNDYFELREQIEKLEADNE